VLVLLIHNRSSGSGAALEVEIRTLFETAGHEVVYRRFEDEKWKDDLTSNSDVVVVVGGDGTVRRVALEMTSKGDAQRPLAIVPAGTANNLARHLGVEGSAERVARKLATARPSLVAVGVLHREGDAEARFLESAGVGLFTRLLRQADDTETVSGGLKLLRDAVERTDPQLVRIHADGVDLTGEYVMVEAMNVGSIGPRLLVAPEADHSDDELDLVLVSSAERQGLIDYLDAIEAKEPGEFPVKARRVRQIHLDWERGHVDDMPWPTDDHLSDRSGETMIEVERHLTVLIP
jgi:diacylglycerol kinase family enzyme